MLIYVLLNRLQYKVHWESQVNCDSDEKKKPQEKPKLSRGKQEEPYYLLATSVNHESDNPGYTQWKGSNIVIFTLGKCDRSIRVK